MIILTQTDNLQISLAGSVTTNQLQCYVSWRDRSSTAFIAGRSVSASNNTTDVNITAAPAENIQRIIDYISVYNTDTVNSTVTIKIDVSGTDYILWKGVLGTGETLQYNEGNGFNVMTIAGAIKQSQMFGASNVAINALNIVVMSEDVVNNDATLNTLADVTGLSFAVTAGETYWFEFTIPYTSQATSTGSRWTLNGPSFSLLHFRSEYTLTATSITTNSATAYGIPAASNATSLTAGNVATIWGYIKASENGTLIARFASEIANSAITAKAGATVRYMRVL